METQLSSLSVDAIRKRSESQGEPGWLTELRAEAREAYEKLPAPELSRTDLSKLDIPLLTAKAVGAPVTATRTGETKDGVIVMDLARAVREHEDLVRPYLFRSTVKAADGRPEALHVANWTAGTFMYVPKGVEVKEPLVADVQVGPEGALTHTLIVAEPMSKVSVVERWRSAAGVTEKSLVTSGVEIVARDGAKVHYAAVQELGETVTQVAFKRADIQRDAHVAWMDAQFGTKTTVAGIESRLNGAGSSTLCLAAFFGGSDQHFDLGASALHRAPHTSSQITAKGALTDKAFCIYKGIVNIGPTAPDASGHLEETTLLLSESARADAIPKLDVENNSVSASHAAAVGQVDPDQLFYIMSRGLGEKAAKRTIVEGFFEPLVLDVPLEGVQDDMRAAIARRAA